MSKMNFSEKNEGKKAAADIEVEDDFDEDGDYDSSSEPENKKKLIAVLLLPFIVIAVVVIFLFVIMSFTGGNRSFEEIEEIMVAAAESYFADHPESLPKSDGGTQTIDVSTLVAEGRMKDLSEYNETMCTGQVKVYKSGTSYLYVPKLECGEAYKFQPLYEKVREDNPIVSSGYGLYNRNGSYVFRGETVNNYVKLDNATWRIVKIASGNQLVLLLDNAISSPQPWDDRYNQDMKYNAGINNFGTSRIKEYLEELYNTNDDGIKSILLSDRDKTRMVTFNFCTGKRGLNETGVEQAVECREVTRNQKLGLLTAADYMNASIDPDCTKASSPTCQNYNYLITEYAWWLATPSSANSYSAYMVGQNSGIEMKNANMYTRIRPVIYLNSEVSYKSGTGTAEDPYTVK